LTGKRRALGRGLDALLEPAKADVRVLPVERLAPNRLQPRRDFDEAGLAELADSIRTQGLVQPIVVTRRDDGYTIVAGERRWRAARLAGLVEVPVVVREVADDRHLLELALVENLQRSDLNPIEEALAYQALADDFGLGQEEIARRVGKARPTIANSLRLLNLPQEIQDLVRAGKLTAGQARPLLAVAKVNEQLALARRAVSEQLSARQLEQLTATRPSSVGSRRKRGTGDVHTAAAAERLTRHLQTRVEIRRRRRGGGVLHLHFHSEEELIRLYDRLLGGGEQE
jgi:ParB family chromosome partitioning protein